MCSSHPSQTNGCYERLFARFYDRMLANTEEKVLGRYRSRLLGQLSGRILEIGCGTGVNFSYYPESAQVTAIEPSLPMLAQAQERAREARAQIRLIDEGIDGFASDTKFDAVVTTLVLCTVPNLESALEKAISLLRVGGRLHVLEHIRSHTKVGASLQRVLRPAWKLCGLGCVLNRPTDQLLLHSPALRALQTEHFRSTLPFFCGSFERV